MTVPDQWCRKTDLHVGGLPSFMHDAFDEKIRYRWTPDYMLKGKIDINAQEFAQSHEQTPAQMPDLLLGFVIVS